MRDGQENWEIPQTCGSAPGSGAAEKKTLDDDGGGGGRESSRCLWDVHCLPGAVLRIYMDHLISSSQPLGR